MTLLEWRKSGERRSLAIDMLNQPTMQEMLAVIEAENPARRIGKLSDGFEATLKTGEIKGFQLALDMLRSMAEPLPIPQQDIPITWGVEPPETKT